MSGIMKSIEALIGELRSLRGTVAELQGRVEALEAVVGDADQARVEDRAPPPADVVEPGEELG